MSPLSGLSAVTTYRVEVSGWDAQQNFFVAKGDLEWGETNGKLLTLPRKVANRAVLFVRLLNSTNLEQSRPVPYEAELLGMAPGGDCEYRLRPLEPRRKCQTS